VWIVPATDQTAARVGELKHGSYLREYVIM
jgi:hypothetical protein